MRRPRAASVRAFGSRGLRPRMVRRLRELARRVIRPRVVQRRASLRAAALSYVYIVLHFAGGGNLPAEWPPEFSALRFWPCDF